MDKSVPVLHFCGYRLDHVEGQLHCGSEIIALRRKTFELLAYLAARPGHLVTKNELLDSIWADTAVGEAVLTTSVRELRQVLADDAREPRIIETQYGRGYRFIAAVHTTAPEAQETATAAASAVGRDAELATLDGWLQQALARKRQVGFVVAEAGIGKTTLVEQFLKRLDAGASANTRTRSLLVAYGQCLEPYSTSEPYLPLIEALSQLCASPDGAALLPLLRQLAPSWLGLLPGLAQGAPASSVTPERMRREMAAVIDALPMPLVLVIEDLHWSDVATVELLARLAQGRAATPLLLIGTYRAAEVALHGHSLKTMHQELLAHGKCRDLWLTPFDSAALTAYLQQRCPGLEPREALAQIVFQRTDGNALFVVNVVDELIASGVLVESRGRWALTVPIADVEVGVPAGLRQLLTTRLERHGEPQRAALEAGSVAGRTFSAAEVAAALELPLVEVEATLDALARRSQVLRAAGAAVWPDTTAASRYEFVHALYEEVLYDLIPAARRSLWHGRMAERLERGYAGQTTEIATHLARHFEVGAMAERAVTYLQEAAERASRYGAEHETVTLLERALALVEALPRTPERTLLAIRIHFRLGQALMRSRGLADLYVERVFARAWALSEEIDDGVQLFQATVGRISGYLARSQFDRVNEMVKHLEASMHRFPLPPFAFLAHMYAGIAQYNGGTLAEARAHLDKVMEIGELPQPGEFMNFWVIALTYTSFVLLHQGYPDQARKRVEQALARAATESVYVQGSAAAWGVSFYLNTRDAAGVAIMAETAQRIGDENGLFMAAATGGFSKGWLLARRGDFAAGIAAMQAGFEAMRANGQVPSMPGMLVTLAETYGQAGDPDEGLRQIAAAQALIQSTGEIRGAAEACRVEGELHRARNDRAAAHAAFERALEIAREQGSRWLELRAAVSQARLLQEQRKRTAARRVLEPVVCAITEGEDCEDVIAARALLAAMA